jgi:capsular exopolysaccharide synthesis family protein
MLNNRIEAWQDIYKATSLPIAGEIAFEGKNKDGIIITSGNRTPIAEQFRTLRTNISYISQGQPHKVLLVTSSISGEGKSFISLNLANTIAITKKKVVLLEFDLRNPGLSDKLGFDETPGIANYLQEEKTIEEIVMPVPEYENLSFISCGTPLPSNPGEIILTNRMQDMFSYLRKHFDYIIVDTPPIEAVSDALTLGKFADLSFFVVRHKYSLRSSLTLVNQLGEDQKIPHPALIINGIKPGHGFQNVYGYGYGNVGKNGRKKKNTNSNLKIA